jgi:hypothetical protein
MNQAQGQALPITVAALCVAAIMLVFHDQYWWPVDEGVYAYVAQRALAGDVIHRDIIDLHAGYGNLLNTLAFRLFGEDLLSLRYPLVFISLVQSAIAYVLLRARGPWLACAGAIAVAAFSFVQFPNPSANWHALLAFFAMCLCLEKLPRGSQGRLLIAGLIVGACFFTRQLNGVFLALGTICVLLAEERDETDGRRAPSLLIGGICFTALLLFLAFKQHLFGLLWAGIWPLGLMLTVAAQARLSWGKAYRTTFWLLTGFVLAGLPLALFNAAQGALGAWLSDILFTALMINGQDFIGQASFLDVLEMAWANLIGVAGTVPVVSALCWIALVLSVPLLGVLSGIQVLRHPVVRPTTLLAVFWSISALHYQITIYLMFVLPAVILALLMARPTQRMALAAICLSAWALLFQAGQPVERGVAGTIAGVRAPANTPANLPRVSLRIQAADAALYRSVINAIEERAQPNEPLMTLPMDPELNFMTARPSPARYYGTPLGLRSLADVELSVAALETAAPLFVIHRRQDKYLTPLSAKLLEFVKSGSETPLRLGPFDLYRYQGQPRVNASSAAQ